MNGMAKTNTYLMILIINNLGYEFCIIGYHGCYGFSWSFMSYLMIFLDTNNSVVGSVLSNWIEF